MMTTVNFPYAAEWCAILPIKGGSQAKSRLGSHPEVASLADEFAKKTLAAILACPEVKRVIIVTGDEYWRNLERDQITTLADPGSGLNAAIRAVRDHEFEKQLLVVVPSDLPILDPIDLANVLVNARSHARAFVRDKNGDGTTILTALNAVDLIPLYGEGSASAHLVSGAIELPAPNSVRFDVDTLADLEQIAGFNG